MVNSLIKALQTTNNITLPDFGGFMKMGNSYIFNEFLKFNDGKFSKYLQENEGLSEDEANSKIIKFIAEIKSTLEKEGSFSLNEIGTFKLINGKIKLEKLKTTATSAPKKVVKKKPEIKSEVKKNIAKEVPVEKKKEEKPKPIVAKENKKNIVKEDSLKKKKDNVKPPTKSSTPKLSVDLPDNEAKEAIASYTVIEDLVKFTEGEKRKKVVRVLRDRLNELYEIDEKELAILDATKVKGNKTDKEPKIKEGTQKEVKKQLAKESKILETVSEKETQKKKNTEAEDLAALTDGAIKLEKEAKRRKRNKIILWIALITIFSGGGIVGYLKQDLVMSWFASSNQIAQNEITSEEKTTSTEHDIKEEDIVSEEEIANTTISEESEVKSDVVLEETTKEIVEEIEPIKEESVESAKSGRYHAIVGSFSKDKNAENLVKELKEEGYSNAGIVQHGKLQSVKLGSYPTSKEAKKALKESGKNGWIKKT